MSADVRTLAKSTALLYRVKRMPSLIADYSMKDYIAFFDAYFTLVESGDDYHPFDNIYIAVEKQYKIFVKPSRKVQAGHIYLLRAIVPDTYYKIGLSKDPITRIKAMGVKLPFPIEPVHTFETDDMYKTESILHDRFADKRINGEWFALSEGDVNYFCSICGWFKGQVHHE